MRPGRLLKDDLLALPGSVGAGVARELVGAKAFPAATPTPVPKAAWILDAVTAGVGGALRAVDYIWGADAMGEIAEGALYPGLAYLSEDLTHEILRNMKQPVAPTGRVQVRAQDAAARGVAPQRQVAPLPQYPKVGPAYGYAYAVNTSAEI